jgi:hypothetical protein
MTNFRSAAGAVLAMNYEKRPAAEEMRDAAAEREFS